MGGVLQSRGRYSGAPRSTEHLTPPPAAPLPAFDRRFTSQSAAGNACQQRFIFFKNSSTYNLVTLKSTTFHQCQVDSKFSVTEKSDISALAPIAVSPVFLIARRPHANPRSSTSRSPVCARTPAGARGDSVRAPRTPDDHNNDESVLFVFTNVHPTPIVRCVCMNRGRLSPIFGHQTLRSVEVMVAAMDLSRPFQRPKYRFHHSTAPLLSFYTVTTACLPIYPPPPNSAHASDTYLASDIDRPGDWEISKTRSSCGAPCRMRGCSFRPPIVSRSRPQRAGFPAAHDQSDGLTRPPYDMYVALRRGCRLTGKLRARARARAQTGLLLVELLVSACGRRATKNTGEQRSAREL